MSKTVIDVLTEARAKVSAGWCQGSNAIDKSGRSVMSESKEACKWCISGAVDASDGRNASLYWEAICLLRTLAGFDYVSCWNDAPGRTQAEVLNLFDRAIEKARGE